MKEQARIESVSSTLVLSGFSLELVKRLAAARRLAVEQVAADAVSAYLAVPEPRPTGWRCRLRPAAPGRVDDRAIKLQLELDRNTLAAVAAESERQGVDPERLVRHAVVYIGAEGVRRSG